MTKVSQLSTLFEQLEAQMRTQKLWQQTPPSAEALMSQQPFAIDMLEPNEWLQWIFIARIRALMEQGSPLPQGFEIAPYFEQAWQEHAQYRELIALIQQIDKVCK